jgi:hypothetical protein
MRFCRRSDDERIVLGDRRRTYELESRLEPTDAEITYDAPAST